MTGSCEHYEENYSSFAKGNVLWTSLPTISFGSKAQFNEVNVPIIGTKI